MSYFFKKYRPIILGVIIGLIGGYLYWHFIGCSSGSCPPTSSPVNTTVAGALLGGLLFSSFEKDNKKEK